MTGGIRVGFAGLGIMGSRMAANLVRAGYDLTVWNRTRERAEAWAREHRAAVADTPAQLAERSDVLITMVVDGPQVREVLLGPAGAVHGAHEGLLAVDMSTIAPADAREIGAELAQAGVAFVDAPVTGSSPRAEDGTLTIMAGGRPQDVERARPLFEAMGELVLRVGDLGQGQMTKLVNNAVAAANAMVLGEALLVAEATGVDLDALVQVMAAGSGNSTMLGLKAGPMRTHDYTTLFKTAHMLKDLGHCLDAAGAAGAPFPTAAQTREVFAAAVGRGRGDDDFASIIEVLEGLAGTRLSSPPSR
jgi:3-hydroxyisobutyrate dehydrogenase-like beta-hydroxyacid dehydrogenase